MGLLSLILRVVAAIILFLLAFEVISDDYFVWLAGSLGLYVTATVLGPVNFGPFITADRQRG